jgi:hypothetical protein
MSRIEKSALDAVNGLLTFSSSSAGARQRGEPRTLGRVKRHILHEVLGSPAAPEDDVVLAPAAAFV